MKTHGRLRRLAMSAALALAATTIVSGERPDAAAGPSQQAAPGHAHWFSFMPQHFIDRKALKLRRDGLLESASHYPRTSASGWTAEQNAQGRYERLERVIDCETGLYVDVALVLLDRDGQPIGRQAMDLDDQLQQIALRQSDVMEHRWPVRSEIALACALARQPEAQDVGGLQVGARSFVDHGSPFDLDALGDAPPPDGRQLFSRLQAQYDAHLDTFAPPRATTSSGRTVAVAQAGERWTDLGLDGGYGSERYDLASMRHVDGRLEVVRQSRRHIPRWPQGIEEAHTDVRLNVAIDCRNGLTVPVEQLFYAEDSDELLHRRSVPVFPTWQSLAHRDPGWSEWLGPQAPTASAQLCRMAAARCLGTAPATAAAFEIHPSTLPDQGGAPLVLAAREAWLRHRAGFVPACPIGGR